MKNVKQPFYSAAVYYTVHALGHYLLHAIVQSLSCGNRAIEDIGHSHKWTTKYGLSNSTQYNYLLWGVNHT
jgi:hypothetical protein